MQYISRKRKSPCHLLYLAFFMMTSAAQAAVSQESGILTGQIRAVANDAAAEVNENPAFLPIAEKSIWSASIRQLPGLALASKISSATVESGDYLTLAGDMSFAFHNLLNRRLSLGLAFSNSAELDYFSDLDLKMTSGQSRMNTQQTSTNLGASLAAAWRFSETDSVGIKMTGIQRTFEVNEGNSSFFNTGSATGNYQSKASEMTQSKGVRGGIGYLFKDSAGEMGFLVENIGIQQSDRQGELEETIEVLTPSASLNNNKFRTTAKEIFMNDVIFRAGFAQYFSESLKGYLEAATTLPIEREIRKFKINNSALNPYKGTRSADPALFLGGGLAWQLNPELTIISGLGYTTSLETRKYSTTSGTSASLTEQTKIDMLNWHAGLIFSSGNINYQGGIGYSLMKMNQQESRITTESRKSSFDIEFHSLTAYLSVSYAKL